MTSARQNFGRYELGSILGGGGFATVYRALDPALGREVALKALLPHLAADATVRQRFLAEARAIAGLHHPNIVTVFDVGEADGRPFFAMELIKGQTLAALLKDRKDLDPPYAVAIIRSLCAAVDYLHTAGIIHRDIKPANVMVEPDGRVVLMDFGIARALSDGDALTRVGDSIGTPRYMSPEQVRGDKVGPATDIYALGVLAYELLAGRPPFMGDTASVLHAQVYDAPPPLRELRPGLAEGLYAAVAAALAKDAHERPAAAGAFATLLERGLKNQSDFIAPPTVWQSAPGLEKTILDLPQDPPPQEAGPFVPPIQPAAALAELQQTPQQTTPFVRKAEVEQVAPHPRRGRGPLFVIVGAIAFLVIGGGAVAAVALRGQDKSISPPTATSVATGRTTASVGVGAPTINGLHVFDNEKDRRETSFQAGDSVAACFALRPGRDTAALAVVLTAHADPPHDANDPTIVGRADPVPVTAGQRCSTVRSLRGNFPPGSYYLWVLQGTTVLASSGFIARGAATATAQPTPAVTASPTVTAMPTPRPTPSPTPRPSVTRPAGTPSPPDLSLPPTPKGTTPNRPSPKITAVIYAKAAVVNTTFEFRVVASNFGNDGNQGSITVSSPEAATLSAEVESCGIPDAKAATLRPGTQVSVLGGGTRATVGKALSRYWIAEVDAPQAWPANAQCTLLVKAQVPAADSMTFLLRAATFAPNDDIVGWPYGGGAVVRDDQQGFKSILWTVPIARP